MDTAESQTAAVLWEEIKTHLKQKRDHINDEIRNYPSPIPACDAQFNYLLEERARLTGELNRLHDLYRQGADGANAIQSLHEFMASL
ncbi:MAG: hypothetical protein KF770_15930 [Anaerolineae bacterium]|nr:hypothetical protein [Anaerolineae bacterium]